MTNKRHLHLCWLPALITTSPRDTTGQAATDQLATPPTPLATPVEDLPVTHDVSRLAHKLKTTHLRLVPNEVEAFTATAKRGCLWAQGEDNMVVTGQRVLLLYRYWMCGLTTCSIEESFPLEDLQYVMLVRVASLVWLPLGLMGIVIGAVMLSAAEQMVASTETYYRSHVMSSQSYSLLLTFGIIFLLGGIASIGYFIFKHLTRTVDLCLNFSRKDVGIVDWARNSWWRPRMSSTRRVIKLDKQAAQEAYNALNVLMHDKSGFRGVQVHKPMRDSVGSIA